LQAVASLKITGMSIAVRLERTECPVGADYTSVEPVRVRPLTVKAWLSLVELGLI